MSNVETLRKYLSESETNQIIAKEDITTAVRYINRLEEGEVRENIRAGLTGRIEAEDVPTHDMRTAAKSAIGIIFAGMAAGAIAGCQTGGGAVDDLGDTVRQGFSDIRAGQEQIAERINSHEERLDALDERTGANATAHDLLSFQHHVGRVDQNFVGDNPDKTISNLANYQITAGNYGQGFELLDVVQAHGSKVDTQKAELLANSLVYKLEQAFDTKVSSILDGDSSVEEKANSVLDEAMKYSVASKGEVEVSTNGTLTLVNRLGTGKKVKMMDSSGEETEKQTVAATLYTQTGQDVRVNPLLNIPSIDLEPALQVMDREGTSSIVYDFEDGSGTTTGAYHLKRFETVTSTAPILLNSSQAGLTELLNQHNVPVKEGQRVRFVDGVQPDNNNPEEFGKDAPAQVARYANLVQVVDSEGHLQGTYMVEGNKELGEIAGEQKSFTTALEGYQWTKLADSYSKLNPEQKLRVSGVAENFALSETAKSTQCVVYGGFKREVQEGARTVTKYFMAELAQATLAEVYNAAHKPASDSQRMQNPVSWLRLAGAEPIGDVTNSAVGRVGAIYDKNVATELGAEPRKVEAMDRIYIAPVRQD